MYYHTPRIYFIKLLYDFTLRIHLCDMTIKDKSLFNQVTRSLTNRLRLNRCGPAKLYGDIELVSNGSGNGPLSDDTKPLPESTLTYH